MMYGRPIRHNYNTNDLSTVVGTIVFSPMAPSLSSYLQALPSPPSSLPLQALVLQALPQGQVLQALALQALSTPQSLH